MTVLTSINQLLNMPLSGVCQGGQPLIFILPQFFADKTLAEFLAEPVSDFIAAAATTIAFFLFFRKLMKEGREEIRNL